MIGSLLTPSERSMTWMGIQGDLRICIKYWLFVAWINTSHNNECVSVLVLAQVCRTGESVCVVSCMDNFDAF